jgi:hypothetical protein
MVDRPAEAPGGLRCEIGSQWRYRFVVVAGIVGELDGNRLGGALRYGAVQLVDRPLGLDALIEPNEANALRQACRAGSKVANGTYKVIIWLLRTDGARVVSCRTSALAARCWRCRLASDPFSRFVLGSPLVFFLFLSRRLVASRGAFRGGGGGGVTRLDPELDDGDDDAAEFARQIRSSATLLSRSQRDATFRLVLVFRSYATRYRR